MKKKLTIGIISLIGFITTIKLAIIYFEANFNPYAFASFCSINEFIDCDGIAKTPDSQFLGIPLAYWGMFLYAFIILMLFTDKLKNFKLLKFLEVFKNPMAYISALGLIAFAISMTLFGISIFHIKKLCILCFFTYILNLIISLVATDFKNGGYKTAFTESFKDFIAALKIKKYLITFIIVMLCATGFLTYTSQSLIFAPHLKRYKSIQEFAKMKTNPYKVSGNVLGTKNGEIKIHVYSDFMCPICPVNDIITHKAVQEFKNVEVIHHNLPLDTDCNPYLRMPFHHNSCTMAKYALAAEKQNKYWDVASALFEKKPKDEAEIITLLKSMKMDTDILQKEAHSAEINAKLQAEIRTAMITQGINATPTTVINGKVHEGIIPYFELKELLIEAGAKK